MNINLEIFLFASDTNFKKAGTFSVNNHEFKNEPDWAAAVTAYKWIQQVNEEMGYKEDFDIIKVVYNGDNDITELTKKVQPKL